VIPIPPIETLRWISTFISIGVKFVLAAYFFHRYSREKAGIPLVWGTGFFFFGLSQVPVVAMRYFGDPTTDMAFALLGALIAALALALLYYGTSLLFFPKGSFMQGKLSIVFFTVMAVVVLAFRLFAAPENILKSVFLIVASGFIFPILGLVALLFFMIWRKLEPENPRRTNVFVVAVAWLVYSVVNGGGTFSVGKPYEWVFYVLATGAFLVLLYGMTVGKATGS